MVDDARQGMQLALCIGLAGEVESPYEVAYNMSGGRVLKFAARDPDFILVTLQNAMLAGFADSAAVAYSMAAMLRHPAYGLWGG